MFKFIGLEKAIKYRKAVCYLVFTIGYLVTYLTVLNMSFYPSMRTFQGIVFFFIFFLICEICYSDILWMEEISRIDKRSFEKLDRSIRKHNSMYIKRSLPLFIILFLAIPFSIYLVRGSELVVETAFFFSIVITVLMFEKYINKIFSK